MTQPNGRAPGALLAGAGERHGHFAYMREGPAPGPDGRPPGFDYPGLKQALTVHKAGQGVRAGCSEGGRG